MVLNFSEVKDPCEKLMKAMNSPQKNTFVSFMFRIPKHELERLSNMKYSVNQVIVFLSKDNKCSLVCNIVLKMVFVEQNWSSSVLWKSSFYPERSDPMVTSYSHPITSKKVIYKLSNSVENWSVFKWLNFGN